VIDAICQIGIILFGGAAIYLIGRKSKQWREIGFVVGLISQCFFFTAIIAAGQWGMFILSCWYTYAYIDGLRICRKTS
jgi:hypothetical protein